MSKLCKIFQKMVNFNNHHFPDVICRFAKRNGVAYVGGCDYNDMIGYAMAHKPLQVGW